MRLGFGLTLFFAVLAAAGTFARGADADEPAIKPADLLKPEMFPEAQYGMGVESAQDGEARGMVVTTGARFAIDKAADAIECAQRIAIDRPVARISMPAGSLRRLKLVHQSSGAAIFQGGGTTLRINGDSLLMVQPGAAGAIRAELAFAPDYAAQFKGNYNFFDPQGGVSFFEHGQQPESALSAKQDPVSVSWSFEAGQVFWAGISPPKAYDWEASIKQRIVLYGSSVERYFYPCDLDIVRWQRFTEATALLLHNENMWKHWQLELVPKNVPEYLRVMRTAHELGMKVLVYGGPKHFLKGTVAEGRAVPDVNDPKASGWASGSNALEFMRQSTRLVKEFETDGFYFDEMYTNRRALATDYYVARASRQLVGDGGPLVLHATEDNLGDRHGPVGILHCPTIHAYFSAIVKGEAAGDLAEPGYIRYVLGTYNISNTIGMQHIDARIVPTPQKLDLWLKHANLRFWTPEHYFFTGDIEVLKKDYWPRLTPKLKEELEPTLLERTGVFDRGTMNSE